MADLRLESDRDQTVIAHLEEFSARVSIVLVVLAALTVLLSQRIDGVLIHWLETLAPCSDCMVVFEPGAWIGLRWTAAIVIAGIMTVPLAVQQAVVFASPALLPGERRRLVSGLMVTSTLGMAMALWFGLRAAPWLYMQTMTTVQSTGLVLALDAVGLVELTLAVMWIMALLGAASGASLGAGLLGRLDRERVRMWRWRISLPIVLLMVGSTWVTMNDLRWPLAIVGALVLELPLLPWRTSEPRWLPTVFDADGTRRRLLVVDCACEGAFGSPLRPPPAAFGHCTARGLCVRPDERTALLERVQDGNATDVVVVGCTTAPLPERFHEAIQSAGATLRGLDLRAVEHRRPGIDADAMTAQRDLALNALTDPWSEEAARERSNQHLATVEKEIMFGPLPASFPTGQLWLERDPQ